MTIYITPEAVERLKKSMRIGHSSIVDAGNMIDALSAALTASQAETAAAWHPIETAPRDGDPVIIWKPDEKRVGEYMMAAYWDDEKDGFIPVGGVNKQGYYSELQGCNQGYPTHWMPLPLPPKGKDHE